VRKSSTTKAPLWLRRALLGVCYWVGHRRAYYRRHPLMEGAIVAELCNLINANLPEKYDLRCEVPYSSFVRVGQQTSVFTERSRVDLCITQPEEGNDPRFIIEVKRGSVSEVSIQADLVRLAEVKKRKRGLRTLLIGVTERLLPEPYVTADGFPSSRAFGISREPDYICKVLSAQKAIHLVTDLTVAHFAYALEVLPRRRVAT
jgi:hypothetical protein